MKTKNLDVPSQNYLSICCLNTFFSEKNRHFLYGRTTVTQNIFAPNIVAPNAVALINISRPQKKAFGIFYTYTSFVNQKGNKY